jgi:hypothetical protein
MLATQDVYPSSTAHLTNDERRQRLREKAYIIDLQVLSFAREAAEFAATDAWEEDGSTSPIDWLRFNCHLTSTVAADRITVGEAMHQLTASVDATMSGEIGFAHLKDMARTADAVGSKFDETKLLEKARENSPGKFHYICRHYRHAADRKGFEAEQAELVEYRKLSITTCDDGAVLVNGLLDPVGGAAFVTAIRPLAQKSGAYDDRTLEQRQADALIELASGGGSQAQIQVTSSIETLLGLAGAAAAEMEFTLPVSSTTVERLACDSSIARILLDSESVVIDVGRSKRVVSEPMRRALAVRDGHCRWPGCERPASWSAAHHVVHWIHGGTTDLDNLILLCHRHHRMVHEGNWQIVGGDDGHILTIPPTVTFGPPVRGPD